MFDPRGWSGLNSDTETLIKAQKHQVWVRFAFLLLFTVYVFAHATGLSSHLGLIIASAGIYCLSNLLFLVWIKRHPVHLLRTMMAPVLDIYLTTLGMWLDGGISSPMYIMYFIIIAGNGMRFGNMMLLYSQILSLLGLAIVGILTVFLMQQGIDWLYLMLQLIGVLLVPGYAYILGSRLENELGARRQAEEDSIGLLDASPIPAFTFKPDSEGNIVIRYANPALTLICGVSQIKLQKQSVKYACIPEDAATMQEGCSHILRLRNDTVHRFEVRSRSHKGKVLSLMCQVSSIRWRGRQLGLCLMSDVTENERLHEKLEVAHRQDYMNSLLAGITHDFRNVLTNIIGTAEILQMEAEKPETEKKLGLIIESGEHASDMITHLLHMARGKKIPDRPIRLQQTLHTTIDLARLRLPSDIGLDCRIDKDLPAILGQPAQLDQVVLNLIENAAHAIEGSGHIEVQVETDPQHTLATPLLPAIRIIVSDTGCGISKENLDHVFDTFWTTREEKGGSGLGLSMVKRIVTWHHGEIAIESSPGKGTSVILHLPSTSEITSPASSQPAKADPADLYDI